MDFISYAREDAAVVGELDSDLRRAKREAWFDRDLEGGQAWWDSVLEHIRQCDRFIFVLSPDSLRSAGCRAELSYATSLRKRILPVMVRDVNIDLAPDPIPRTQWVDYRQRTSESAIALTIAISRLQTEIFPPDPLPPPPPAPISSLGPVREQLASEQLGLEEQQEIVADLTRAKNNTEERITLLQLAEQLLERPDLTVAVKRDVDSLIASLPVADGHENWTDQIERQTKRLRSENDPHTADLLRSLVTHIRAGRFTPVTGTGMTDSLIGPRRHIASEWARTFEFPTARRRHDDLAGAAQFVSVMTNVDTLRSTLGDYFAQRLRDRYPEALHDMNDRGVGELLRSAWHAHREEIDSDPHMVLARLPCSIYITAHPGDLMAEALRLEGKEPEVDLCRWRAEVYDWPKSVLEAEPEYNPTVNRPLVYHIFGAMDVPDSLVLSEDDYFDFLISVTEDKSLIPGTIRRALADSALLLLGFGLDDWDMRIVLRALINQEGRRKLDKYTHLAAQLERRAGIISPERRRQYLERYFGKVRSPSIDIYWGSVLEFAADLDKTWEALQ